MSLEQNMSNKRAGEGRLPAMAPLANPYVPFQLENPPKYDAKKAFVRGTLFPGLDLPFMGMVNKNEKTSALNQLQTLAFVIQELALYLNTHREDKEALEVYRSFQKMHEQCRQEYESVHGPMNHHSVTDGEYRWLDDPWPWEYAKNGEV